MTLAAPRSRQGRAFLVLAILAVSVAILGAFFWANGAQADISSTSVNLTDNAGATINPGGTITYTATVTQSGVVGGTTTNTRFDVTLDAANISSATVTSDATAPWITAECSYNALTGVASCIDATGPVASDSITITAIVKPGGDGDVDPPTACSVVDDGTGAASCTLTDIAVVAIDAGATGPAPATNPIGTPHTFTFTLNAGVTCASDNVIANPVTGNDATRNCQASDVTLTPGTTGATVTGGPTVVGAVLAASGDVTVTITGTTGGTATVDLHLRYEGTPEVCITSIEVQGTPCEDLGDDAALPDVSATKIYAVAAGSLCHLDLPDAATEDAAGNINGILSVNNTPASGCSQSDVDDATGSFHAACIEGSTLTFATNNAELTWNIVAVNGGPVAQSQTSFAGPTGEPCVMWAAGGTGTQNITAVWTSAPGITTTFYWNGACQAGVCTLAPGTGAQQPLIKEWNTIDFTKIISSTGNVGDTIDANTGGLADWAARDCIDSAGICGQANLDGTTKDIGGVLMPSGNVSATGATFIDYTMGSHNDAGGAYNGPVDGAQQTYTISGGCGSVRLENPTEGDVIILSNAATAGSTYTIGPPPGPYAAPVNPYESAIINSSDKGVGFQVLPNSAGDPVTTSLTSDCQPDDCVTVTIDTQEAGLFHSPPLVTASTETITVCFHVGPPTNKQPQLAWAGQRVVLEHDWSFVDADGVRTCPFDFAQGDFFVRYVKESGNGAFIDDLGHGAASGPDFMVVRVHSDGDSNTDPEGDCISRVIYEAQDQGEQDIVAHVVQCAPIFGGGSVGTDGFGGNIDPDTCSVVSGQVAFLLFYMKFEDIKLTLIPGETTHSAKSSQESTVVNPPAGEADTTANVSENVLARAAVRGWVLADNCPAANVAKTGSNGEALPANRCIFPDDWLFKAGGNASDVRKNYDNYGGDTTGCINVAGPYSSLDPIVFDSAGDRDIVCGDSMAPHANGGFRETNFPDGVIDANDAPMPSALIRFLLDGSGFLTGTVKSNPTTQFNVTHIPAEPWIAPTNADLSGYQWNSWGNGPKSGVYHYWTDFADHGPQVLSCGGASSGAFVPGLGDPDPCGDGSGVATGGYLQTRVYSDEHGVAMTWINGDANLDFGDCDNSTPTDEDHDIVLLNGFFCESGDVVGSSTLNALADYPDKRKHFAVLSDDVTIDWTWGGIKEVTVEPGSSAQFNYVVFHVTDRDGFCGGSPSLHPVLGEVVQFRIDSDAGVIFPNVNGDSAAGPAVTISADGKQATTHTFDTDVEPSVANGGLTVEPVLASNECQAWIHVSESLLGPVNVIVTAFDPEGTVTFDTTGINPTPTPSPTPSPSPTPTPVPTVTLIWGDTDCGGTVAPRDGQAILKRILEQPELSVNQPCPGMGQEIIIGGTHYHWADFDCSGSIAPRDGQAILKNVLAQTALGQTEPCPDVGSSVQVQVVSLP